MSRDGHNILEFGFWLKLWCLTGVQSRDWRTSSNTPNVVRYVRTAAQFGFLCYPISRCIGEEMLESLKVTILTWYLASWEAIPFSVLNTGYIISQTTTTSLHVVLLHLS